MLDEGKKDGDVFESCGAMQTPDRSIEAILCGYSTMDLRVQK
jgi:hypothetical protein